MESPLEGGYLSHICRYLVRGRGRGRGRGRVRVRVLLKHLQVPG